MARAQTLVSSGQCEKQPDDPVAPDVVFEVWRPGHRWRDVFAKVIECFKQGVKVICVANPAARSIHIYSADEPPQVIIADNDCAT